MPSTPYRVFTERKKQLFVSLPVIYAVAAAVVWFFYHVGEQGYPWATWVAYFMTALLAYHLARVITLPGFSLELSNEGLAFISRRSKRTFIPWTGIETISGTYGGTGSGSIFPDFIVCDVKPAFKKKRRFGFYATNYIFDLPYNGIFSVELIGYLEEERIKHSRQN